MFMLAFILTGGIGGGGGGGKLFCMAMALILKFSNVFGSTKLQIGMSFGAQPEVKVVGS